MKLKQIWFSKFRHLFSTILKPRGKNFPTRRRVMMSRVSRHLLLLLKGPLFGRRFSTFVYGQWLADFFFSLIFLCLPFSCFLYCKKNVTFHHLTPLPSTYLAASPSPSSLTLWSPTTVIECHRLQRPTVAHPVGRRGTKKPPGREVGEKGWREGRARWEMREFCAKGWWGGIVESNVETVFSL